MRFLVAKSLFFFMLIWGFRTTPGVTSYPAGRCKGNLPANRERLLPPFFPDPFLLARSARRFGLSRL